MYIDKYILILAKMRHKGDTEKLRIEKTKSPAMRGFFLPVNGF